MRPYGLIEDSPGSLADDEISRGELIRRGAIGHTRKSYRILESFRDILGKPVSEAPPNDGRSARSVETGFALP
ncbi:MAG: hypothetical protein ABW039_12705 [Sphingobium sp.]